MAELCQEAGLPDGVLNLVTGPPDPTGEALITHPGIEKITFTGSRAVGTRMMHAASERIARVSLELGGKSPNLIFDDIDVGAVAMGAMGMVSMGLSGQGCVCHTRALVQDTIYDDFVAAAAEFAGRHHLRRSLRRRHHQLGADQPAPARPGHRLHREGPGRRGHAGVRRRSPRRRPGRRATS